jgi:alpha-L-fucosidase 2
MLFTRRKFVGLLSSLAAAFRLESAQRLAQAATLASPPPIPGEDLSLWFEQPSAHWQDSLPVGNGRLGAMVFGGVARERIALNEDTLWSGAPSDWNNPAAPQHLPVVRKLVLEDQDYQAADRECQKMQGPWNQAYEPLGDLLLEFDHGPDATNYRRSLDLDAAVSSVEYDAGGARYRREVFASAPDNVIVVRLASSKPGSLNFTAKLASQMPFSVAAEGGEAVLRGKAPSYSAPNYYDAKDPIRYSPEEGQGMRFAAVLRCHAPEGRVTARPDGSLRVENASSALLVIGAATGYRGYAVAPATPIAEVVAAARKPVLSVASAKYETLLRRHTEDYRALFRRVSLTLGAPSAHPNAATDKRVAAFAESPDPSLLALFFQFGRYLTIASSRPGTQPANLQGIWNVDLRPAWSSNWTSNINVQMNYWPTETCNLSECALPLVEMIRDLSVNGAKTAEINYGAPGWVSHHNIDLWRQSGPVGLGDGSPTWANFAMSGPWLCAHLWEHYLFTGDKEYLRRTAYPVMRGSAEFCLAWLVEDGKGGLTTCPSVSTENIFQAPNGKPAAVSAGCTMDVALTHELFKNCVESSEILGIDADFAAKLAAASKRLPPYKIGRYGQLQEWSVDFIETYPGMRHMSHLYPVYPGSQITPTATPELAQAARKSLERRLEYAKKDGSFTGWARAWAIGLWARLGDGDMAWESLQMLVNHSLNGNFLDDVDDTHPAKGQAGDFTFEIDANFGAPAGIAEMLLQSHEGEIAFLPALPSAWGQGAVRGLRARGGAEVDIAWASPGAGKASVRILGGGTYRFRAPKGQRFLQVSRAVNGRAETVASSASDPGRIEVQAKPGEVYGFQFAASA